MILKDLLLMFKCQEHSKKDAFIASVVVLLVISNLPMLMLLRYIWDRIEAFIGLFRRHKHAISPLPGHEGLPFVGESLAFRLNSKSFFKTHFQQFGDIFLTSFDFSGWYYRAKRVICVLDSPLFNIARNNFKYLGYHGFYGGSHFTSSHVKHLSIALLHDPELTERWETIVTPIIRSFFNRLIFESSFSFADKVNELACEIIATVFLGMEGLSITLLHALDQYLTVSQHQHSINASLRQKSILTNFIQAAIFEEDRKHYSKDIDLRDQIKEITTGTSERRDTIISILLDMISISLDEIVTEADKNDLFFIFLVEHCYRTLVQQLRILFWVVLTDRPLLLLTARSKYQGFLNANQQMDSQRELELRHDPKLKSTLLNARDSNILSNSDSFYWASVINNQAIASNPDPDNSRNASETANVEFAGKEVHPQDSGSSKSQFSSSPRHPPPLTFTDRAKFVASAVWENVSKVVSPTGHAPVDVSDSSDEDEDEGKEFHFQEPAPNKFGVQSTKSVKREGTKAEEPPAHSKSSADAQYQEMLSVYMRRELTAFNYMDTIKSAVEDITRSTVYLDVPVQYSLLRSEQSTFLQKSVVNKSFSVAIQKSLKLNYLVHPGDFLLVVHRPSHLLLHQQQTITKSNDEFYNASCGGEKDEEVVTEDYSNLDSGAMDDLHIEDQQPRGLGLFSDLILSIVLHELVTSYTWSYEHNPALDAPFENHNCPTISSGFCSIPNGALRVRSFHPSSSAIFLFSQSGK